MKIKNSFPPNYEEICKHFPVKDNPYVVFTYGDTIYTPNGGTMSEDLIVHEQTHIKQQGDRPNIWWSMYFDHKDFRLEQELEAYSNQYQYGVTNFTRNHRRALLDKISKDLARPMYGKLVTREEAKELIKNYEK